MVGRLGFVGVAAVLGIQRSPNRCLMSVPGYALRIPVSDLLRAAHRYPDIQQQLFGYIHALLVQNTQTTLCSARHSLEERLSRWLLLAADRLDDRVIPVTHDMLSVILGVRRASITTTLAELERTGGLVRQRGGIDLCDRAALERRTCECYQIIASEYGYLSRGGLHEHGVLPHRDVRGLLAAPHPRRGGALLRRPARLGRAAGDEGLRASGASCLRSHAVNS